MWKFRHIATRSRAAGVAGCMALICLLAGPAFSDGGLSRVDWKEKYRRPVDIPYPDDNLYSKTKFWLGEMLFFDPILSGSQTVSCASCHIPWQSWSNNLPRAIGENKTVLALRVPTLLNVAWVPRPGWDGHFRDLENVAFGPITSANNMNLSESELVKRLSAITGYVEAFDTAFGEGEITRRKIELALATYERSIVSSELPFDRWIKGDKSAIDDAAKRGFDLFNGKAHCASCHSGWAFTNSSFYDIGTARDGDVGRGRLFPTSTKLRYAFKTPTLRDAARRAPYMHDGSVATLQEVIDLYDRGGIDRPSRSERIFPLKLAAAEKADLLAFLGTLTGKSVPVPIPPLPR